jgi:antitoxin (DNA-binding transcriptional repressor) of toxin-antitoxin stability system
MKPQKTAGMAPAMPQTMGAARFKEQCLAVLDRLGPDGLVITKRGKPVARLLPYSRDSARLIGSLRDKVKIKGDIMSTGIRWDAEC